MDLYNAAYKGETEIVRLLLDKNAEVNAQGGLYGNALQAAAYEGKTEIVRLLLDKNAEVNAQGGQYGNALQAAAYTGQTEIVQLLLDKSAEVNAQGGPYVHALHAAILSGNIDVLTILLRNNPQVDVNIQDASGRTPLHIAVETSSPSAVTQLLKKNAQTNKQDFRSATPLQLAVQKRDYQNALLLLSKSVDSLCFIEASTWRSLLPGSDRHLELVNGQSTTIMKRVEEDIKNRRYPFSHGVTELDARDDDFMGTDIHSRRILYVLLSSC
jgi:ankyrin repeat protein